MRSRHIWQVVNYAIKIVYDKGKISIYTPQFKLRLNHQCIYAIKGYIII